MVGSIGTAIPIIVVLSEKLANSSKDERQEEREAEPDRGMEHVILCCLGWLSSSGNSIHLIGRRSIIPLQSETMGLV